MNRRGILYTFLGLAVLFFSAGAATAQSQSSSPQPRYGVEEDLGTAFAYQGQLKDTGGPINGTCDFQFGLWDSLEAPGGQIGRTQTRTGVSLTDGFFTIPDLDFGVGVFTGAARWLQVAVKCTGEPPYIPLVPRQRLSPTPYALYATSAGSADYAVNAGSAANANLIDNLDSTAFAAAVHLHTGDDITSGTVAEPRLDPAIARDSEILPAVLANDGPGSGLDADTLDGLNSGAFAPASHSHAGSEVQNVIVVAKSGGAFTSIQAALDSITTNSATNPYLIWVAPGTYTETVVMKSYVDIEGDGELLTRITASGSAILSSGTVVGASNSELRFLTVENSGLNNYAVAIYNEFASPRLTQVAAAASGAGFNYGVYNDSSSPTMVNVTAVAQGPGGANYGVYNNSSSPTMTYVTASATAPGGANYGVYNNSSSPTMTSVMASASAPGGDNYGVYNDSSSPTMTHMTAAASWGTTNYGIYNDFSSPTMAHMTVAASEGTTNYGIYNYSSSPTISSSAIRATGLGSNFGISNFVGSGVDPVTVNNSSITGSTNTIINHGGFTAYVYVGATLLDGGPVSVAPGPVTCAGVYDEAYVFSANTCP